MNPITNEEIDALLDRHRPDRYLADDHAWRNPVVASISTRMPVRQAQQIAAERMVSEREGRATRGANDMLRRVDKEKQWPLLELVADLARRPLSIGAERVCLSSATAQDFELWAIDERRRSAQDFAARSSACDGAEWIASQMRSKGLTLFSDAYSSIDVA